VIELAPMRWLAAAFAAALSLTAHAAPVPESARSRAVERAVAPRLAAEMRQAGLRLGAPVFLRITKQPGRLELWVEADAGGFVRFKAYPICAFSGALGPKQRVGDNQAPEGFYVVPPSRMNPASAFHLSFDLGYPNAFDRAHGRTGSALMVHGNCVSIGCYALGDAAIEEVWTAMAAAFRAGQPFVRVHAFPFPMTPENLAAHPDSANAAFWADLGRGWDVFERKKRPPDVRVVGGRYLVW
jgi:murein L,D-transpeptidase YafK